GSQYMWLRSSSAPNQTRCAGDKTTPTAEQMKVTANGNRVEDFAVVRPEPSPAAPARRGSSLVRRRCRPENVAACRNNFPVPHWFRTSPSASEKDHPHCRATVSER